MSGAEVKIKEIAGFDSKEFKKFNWNDGRSAKEQINIIPNLKEYVIITESQEGGFHKLNPIQVKREMKKTFERYNELDTFRYTRNNKMLITMKIHECACEMVNKEKIFDTKVEHNLMNKNIIMRL